MRRISHVRLGQFLRKEYLPHVPALYARAFLLGCTEPDKNPTTYLKGSLRAQWLRGHNYENASRFIRRLAIRLERKNSYNLWDYYTLGKLIHYTADAFTYAHNSSFPTDLQQHHVYEVALQNYFLDYLAQATIREKPDTAPVWELIRSAHDQYLKAPSHIFRDTDFAFSVACAVMQRLAIAH